MAETFELHCVGTIIALANEAARIKAQSKNKESICKALIESQKENLTLQLSPLQSNPCAGTVPTQPSVVSIHDRLVDILLELRHERFFLIQNAFSTTTIIQQLLTVPSSTWSMRGSVKSRYHNFLNSGQCRPEFVKKSEKMLLKVWRKVKKCLESNKSVIAPVTYSAIICV